MKKILQAVQFAVVTLTLGAAVMAHADMVTITNGPFLRGDDRDGNVNGDAPTKWVNVSAFNIESIPVTYEKWKAVYDWATAHNYFFSQTGAAFSGIGQPAQSMNWYDAVKWCNARTEMDIAAGSNNLSVCYYDNANPPGVYRTGEFQLSTNNVDWTATGYGLPTEAEWEKAARGGLTGSRFPNGDSISHREATYQSPLIPIFYDAGPVSVFPSSTTPAGILLPNNFGLHDMAGNVSEWCWDAYSKTYYSSSLSTNDPTGPITGVIRVNRGGGWGSAAGGCTTALRLQTGATGYGPQLGFRCVQANLSPVTMAFTPVLQGTVTTTSSLFYGQKLSAIDTNTISGTFFDSNNVPVPGTFAFVNPTSIPNAGTDNATVTFIPSDPVNFTTVTTTVAVTVYQVTPQLTPPAAITINTNVVLTDSLLTGGAARSPYNVAVAASNNHWSFVAQNTFWSAPTSNSVDVNWIPQGQDAINFTSAVTNVPVVVIAQTPPKTNTVLKGKLTAKAINYGQALSNSIVAGVFTNSAVTNVAGSFMFANAGVFPNAGSNNWQVIFTPLDPNYLPSTNNVGVIVKKAVPQLVLNATGISYGQILTNSILTDGVPPSTAENTNNNTPVAGTFAFITPSLLNAGTNHNVSARFTPTDLSNYTLATNQTDVVVAKADPILTVVVQAGIDTHYGQSLSNTVLSASKAINPVNHTTVLGGFVFTNLPVPLAAGTQTVTVAFIPASSANYNIATNTATVIVGKTPPTLTAKGTNYVTVGQNLGTLTPTGITATNAYNKQPVLGAFTFTNAPLTKPGLTNLFVTFTPFDTTNYANGTILVKVLVAPAPTNNVFLVSFTATPLTYGQALSNSTPSGVYVNGGGVIVPGTNSFANPGYVPDAGTPSVAVIFTPTGVTYKPATNTVAVTVAPAPLTIVANDATWDMFTSYPVFTVNCTGLMAKDIVTPANITNLVGTDTVFGTNLYVWSPATNNVLPNGTYTNFIIPILVGLTTNNYIVSYGWGNLTIENSSTPSFAVPKAQVVNGVVTPSSLTSFLGTYNVDQAGLNAVLAHYWAGNQPYMTNPKIVGMTNFVFAVANFSFAVQGNNDLSNSNGWQNIGPTVFQFTDPSAVANQKSFYRIVAETNSP